MWWRWPRRRSGGSTREFAAADAAYDRRWWTLAVLCLSLIVISVDNTILNVALPSIVRELDAQGSQLQWIIDAYTIVFAGLLLTAGSLGDRLGRKRRAHHGPGAVRDVLGAGVASDLAGDAHRRAWPDGHRRRVHLPDDAVDPHEHVPRAGSGPRAIGIWAGVSGLGIVIGPLGGGLLLEHFSWGSVFLVNVPICIAAIVLGHFFVPDSRDPEEGRLDPLGAALSIVALGGPAVRDHRGPDMGWGSAPRSSSASPLGVVFLGAVPVVGDRTRPPDARRALLPEPTVLGGVGHDHADVLRAVRLDVPADPVLPVRARLLAAQGRDA